MKANEKVLACILAAMVAAFPAHAASVENGQEIFSKICAACHGIEGKGGIAPALNNQTFLSMRSDDYIKSVVANGKPEGKPMPMPAMSSAKGGTLSDSEIEDVVAFVRSWQTAAPASPIPKPASGEELFASYCVACHGEKGKGAAAAPALAGSKFILASSDADVKSVISEGRVQKGMPSWKAALSSEQIDEIIKYIRTLKKEELGVHLTQWNIGIVALSVLFAIMGLVYVYKHT